MKKLLFITSLLGIATAFALLTGCSTTNQNEIINSVSGTGTQIDASVPVTKTQSIGLKLFVGKFNNTTAIIPTRTNKVYAATTTILVGSRGKQSVLGGSTLGSTNGTATIGAASIDVSAIATGAASVDTGGNTNSGSFLQINGDK